MVQLKSNISTLFCLIQVRNDSLWQFGNRSLADKGSDRGQIKGGIQMAKRGENIHKRKDGRWEGRYIKGRTADGKPIWGYLYGHAYHEVKEELTRRKALSGFYQLSRKSMQFSELAELWLSSFSQSIKESTYAHYQYTLHKYLLPVLGSLSVSSLTDSLLERLFLQVLSPADRSHRTLGASSAQECLGMLRRICKYGAHLHLMPPMELCIKLPRTKKPEPQPLTQTEQASLRDFLLSEPTTRKAGMLLQTELGLRIGEVCGLQWGDFDLNEGIVIIRRTVCRISCGNGHTRVVIQTPKTRHSNRELPLPSPLLKLLRKLHKNYSDRTWFLSGTEERPVEPRCYRKSIQCYLKQARVRKVHPHVLRHTFATTCLQAGCDIKTLSELLGHSSAAITLQRYVHSDLNRKRQELECITRWLQKGSERSQRAKQPA